MKKVTIILKIYFLFSEAEYAYSQRKDIVPLLLQSGYAPDGWLGILVGTRLYFDLSSEEMVDVNINKLVKELGSRGRCSSAASSSTASSSSVSSPHLSLDMTGRSRRNSECK